ncbi:MAG: hypothetical protein QXE18_00030 [Thermoplasmata archaeon]
MSRTENDEKIPAPRGYGCPACLTYDRLFYCSSLGQDERPYARCERDGWSGQLASLKYEQYFVGLARRRSRNISVVGIATIVIMVVVSISLSQMYPPQPYVFLKVSNDGDNWILTVNRIQNASQISIADIAIKIVTSDNATLVPSTPLLSSIYQDRLPGLAFVNRYPLDYLNTNESFTLDMTIYSAGNLFMLTGLKGAPVYCRCELKS